MPNIVLDNLPFPQEDMDDERRNVCLGRFMTAWAQVEVVCSFLFRELTGARSENALIIFDRITTNEQIKIVRELANQIADETVRTALVDEMKNVENESEKRNKIVHARWGAFDGEPARFWNGMTRENINDIVNEMGKAISLRSKNIHTIEDIDTLTASLLVRRDNLHGYLGKVGDFTYNERFRLTNSLMDARRDNMELTRKLHELSNTLYKMQAELRARDQQDS